MAKRTFGLTAIEIGTIESDGGMATVVESIGDTVSGTADLTTTDPTVADFNTEESDSPIESVVTAQGKIEFVFSTYNVDGYTLVRLFGGTYTPYKSIATFGAITGGTGYTNGTFKNVLLTGGTGQMARANITVAGGIVTVVTLVHGGFAFTVADVMTAPTSVIGAGTGFSIPVATLANSSATQSTYEAADVIPDIERSLKITDKKGSIIQVPRAKLASKLGLSFKKDKLGQVDVKATVLQPNKAGEKRLKITYAN